MFSSITAITAVLTTVLSVGVKVVGMPDQIRNNYRRKSTEGLSSWFLWSTLLSYGLWVVHGLQVHDMSLVIGQSLGVLVTAVIVAQMIMYKKTNANVKPAKRTMLWTQAHRAKTFSTAFVANSLSKKK